jgi:hypothetical protein
MHPLPPHHMTLRESPRFANACDPAATQCHLARMPAWDRINALLPGRMAVTDIDGLIEHHGSLLVIEAKGAGVPVVEGQRRALLALSRHPDVDVWITRPYPLWPDATENILLRSGAAVAVYPEMPRPGGGYQVWTGAQYDQFVAEWVMDARRPR